MQRDSGQATKDQRPHEALASQVPSAQLQSFFYCICALLGQCPGPDRQLPHGWTPSQVSQLLCPVPGPQRPCFLCRWERKCEMGPGHELAHTRAKHGLFSASLCTKEQSWQSLAFVGAGLSPCQPATSPDQSQLRARTLRRAWKDKSDSAKPGRGSQPQPHVTSTWVGERAVTNAETRRHHRPTDQHLWGPGPKPVKLLEALRSHPGLRAEEQHVSLTETRVYPTLCPSATKAVGWAGGKRRDAAG